MFTATYSPEDNKLRLYASTRLDKELYQRVKAHGFIWAPKQDLFVAPMWTPAREDFLLELCDDIEDEDKSLVERQEERAERFEGYKENRAADAERARETVHAIADNIPLGQPILVGHHSERHARRDAEKIENGMRSTVKFWKQSEYWKSRAAGAIRHAKYKERPDVRAKRIKGIEADKRRQERSKAEAERHLKFWSKENITLEQAIFWTGHTNSWLYLPRKEGDREDWTQSPGAYTALNHSFPNLYAPRTVEEVTTAALAHYPHIIENCERWIEHCENRLAYEKAMLEEQGASKLLEPAPREKQPPLLNYRQPVFALSNPYHRGETITYNQIDMTAAKYANIWRDYKGTRIVDGTHRIRTAMVAHSHVAVFLTDSKVHEKPEPPAPKPPTPAPPPDPIEEITQGRTIWNSDGTDGPCLITSPPPAPKALSFADEMKAMQERLKEGVKVVVADQLFPTPPDLAQRMVDEADIEPGQEILEPSAGTGNILKAINMCDGFHRTTAIEINQYLADEVKPLALTTICTNFLECKQGLGTFDRIIMNPPFQNGADIKHILHALTFLRPGGRLVAICANGPRQQEKLRPLASLWEELPEDTFKQQGTGVRTVLLTIEGAQVKPILAVQEQGSLL
jgi:protein-L-isoaspartate O-methyltransferase